MALLAYMTFITGMTVMLVMIAWAVVQLAGRGALALYRRFSPMSMTELTAAIQAHADAEHERQGVCSWCGKPGEPYEHNGVKFDGLTACEGDRLCSRCKDLYLVNTPLLVEDRVRADQPGVVYDLNPNTAAWSEKNIPGCHGEPGITPIAPQYRYADYVRPTRRNRRG
jgi:hypothetical protein